MMLPNQIKEKAQNISLMIFDVDGVLTVTITDLNTGEVTEIVIGGAAGGG